MTNDEFFIEEDVLQRTQSHGGNGSGDPETSNANSSVQIASHATDESVPGGVTGLPSGSNESAIQTGATTYDQLPVGFIAQLVEHCTGIAEFMGSNPAQA